MGPPPASLGAVSDSQLLLLAAVAVAAPLFSLGTRKVVPGIIFEMLLGLLIGPALLGLVEPTGFIDNLATVGIALLMFIAGTEVNLNDFRGPALKRAGGSWLASLALAALVGVGIWLAGYPGAALLIAIGLSTTALGTLVPILRDKNVLDKPLGRSAMTMGTLGEFGPIVLISLLLTSTRGPVPTILFILAFGALVALWMWALRRYRFPRLVRVLEAGLNNPSQLPIRLALLVVIFFVFVAVDAGIDPLLGAFCAGLVVRQALGANREARLVRLFEGKIEAVGFGFLVPVFFIVSGMKIDLQAMIASPWSFALIPAFALAFLLCRGLPVFLAYRSTMGQDGAKRLALLAASAISLVTVVAGIGQSSGALSPALAAAFVVGGLVTVSIYPVLALRGVEVTAPDASDPAAPQT